MKKTIISCVLFLTAVTAFSQTPMKTAAEAKLSASDLAVKIADRILATTTYEFKNTKTGKTYKSVKNLPLDMNVKVACKYNNWRTPVREQPCSSLPRCGDIRESGFQAGPLSFPETQTGPFL